MNRNELINILIEKILAITLNRPTLVAIDGRDSAGKTFLAKELAKKLRKKGRTVIEASIDGFHNSKKIRYMRGRDSPEGYYRDSFDIASLKKILLDPLRRGDLIYRTEIFNYRIDERVESAKKKAAKDSILLFEGVFTLQPSLRTCWDFSIYLCIDEEEIINRAINRDPGDETEIRRRYMARYIPGQKIYHDEAEPLNYADVIIDNNDPENPMIL